MKALKRVFVVVGWSVILLSVTGASSAGSPALSILGGPPVSLVPAGCALCVSGQAGLPPGVWAVGFTGECDEYWAGTGEYCSVCPGGADFCDGELLFASANVCEFWCSGSMLHIATLVETNDVLALRRLLDTDQRVTLNTVRGAIQVTSTCSGEVEASIPVDATLLQQLMQYSSRRQPVES